MRVQTIIFTSDAVAHCWRCTLALALATVLGLIGQSSYAHPGPCGAAIARAEAGHHVPDAFLDAIARVESGRPDAATGALVPWPWTVNAEGQGSFHATKAQAIDAVRALQARGVRSIDVGCLQVNLQQHPNAFASLEEAFDPDANAGYAAGFLVQLFAQMGSWPLAAAAYHSQTPTLGAPYQKRVMAEWAVPLEPAGGPHGRQNDAPKAHGSQTAEAGQAAHDDASFRSAPGSPAGGGGGSGGGGGGGGAAFGRASPMGAGPPRAGGPGPVGRNLASYRLIPIRMALRAPPKPG
jgi:hypothetical protein